MNANLRFHIQQSDFALLVDLLNRLNFGTEHISLEAAILQQLVSRDALGHGFIGDEKVLLSVGLVLTLGSGGVCAEGDKDLAKRRFDKLSSWHKEKRVFLRGAG